ncbi:MAG TPA: hypothetical protein VMI06_16810 [Terriglobia bacterium]|nr:hypothetical protein [Terriglobia bacterium]
MGRERTPREVPFGDENHNLSHKHRDEGEPVALGVCIRAALKESLEKIAEREERSLDYVIDEALRWAVDQYCEKAYTLRQLVRSTVYAVGTTWEDDIPEIRKPSAGPSRGDRRRTRVVGSPKRRAATSGRPSIEGEASAKGTAAIQ